MNLTATLIALFGPFIVWPFEFFIPHPFVIEELFKFILVKTIIKNTPDYSDGLKTAFVSGVLFTVSETVLYILKINTYGDISLLLTRFISTGTLHTATFIIIFVATKKKHYWILGILTAMLLHYLYNLYI